MDFLNSQYLDRPFCPKNHMFFTLNLTWWNLVGDIEFLCISRKGSSTHLSPCLSTLWTSIWTIIGIDSLQFGTWNILHILTVLFYSTVLLSNNLTFAIAYLLFNWFHCCLLISLISLYCLLLCGACFQKKILLREMNKVS